MNLKVPGLEFSAVKAYQFREKELSGVSQHGHIYASGHISLHNVRSYSVRNSNAWRIIFKNVSPTAVNVMLNFSIHDKYGKRDDFAKVVRNLRPNEPADIDLRLSQKAERIQLNTIEVYHDEETISRIEVNHFLPRMAWGPKSWVVGLVLAYLCAMMNLDLRPNNNFVNIILPFFGLTLMGAGLVKRTPVVIALLFFAVLPFSTHSLGRIAILAALAVLYLVVVWIRRRSIKDFFRGTATA